MELRVSSASDAPPDQEEQLPGHCSTNVHGGNLIFVSSAMSSNVRASDPLTDLQRMSSLWPPAYSFPCRSSSFEMRDSPHRTVPLLLTGGHPPLYCAPLREGPGAGVAIRSHCKRVFWRWQC